MPYADLSFGEHLGALSPACFRGGWLGHTSALPLAGRTLMPKVGKSLGWTRLQIPKAEPRVAAGAHVIQIPQTMGRHSLKDEARQHGGSVVVDVHWQPLLLGPRQRHQRRVTKAFL